jgi:hypothetical protein
MHVKHNGAGRESFKASQQLWGGDEAMQRALFAGQVMMARTDDTSGFDLHYLGFQTGGFKTIEDAKAAAPAFARKVLGRLAELIAD